MMENGTMTPFPVKMSVKEEGVGTFSTMALLTLGNPDQTAMSVVGHLSGALWVTYKLAE